MLPNREQCEEYAREYFGATAHIRPCQKRFTHIVAVQQVLDPSEPRILAYVGLWSLEFPLHQPASLTIVETAHVDLYVVNEHFARLSISSGKYSGNYPSTPQFFAIADSSTGYSDVYERVAGGGGDLGSSGSLNHSDRLQPVLNFVGYAVVI